jgi:glutamate synthase (NADPH/NADH) large chain
MAKMNGLPPRQGLYDPAREHDACGVAFVAHIKGRKSHDIVEKGLTILQQPAPSRRDRARSLHGDGAASSSRSRMRSSAKEMAAKGVKLPKAGRVLASEWCSCRATPRRARRAPARWERAIVNEGQVLSAGATFPVDDSVARGHGARDHARHPPGVRGRRAAA